ncbi:MAG: hypothetical protein AVDCRST_MAG66-4893, partial [uncultured Pseudonocardia sp.]
DVLAQGPPDAPPARRRVDHEARRADVVARPPLVGAGLRAAQDAGAVDGDERRARRVEHPERPRVVPRQVAGQRV